MSLTGHRTVLIFILAFQKWPHLILSYPRQILHFVSVTTTPPLPHPPSLRTAEVFTVVASLLSKNNYFLRGWNKSREMRLLPEGYPRPSHILPVKSCWGSLRTLPIVVCMRFVFTTYGCYVHFQITLVILCTNILSWNLLK